MPELSAGTTTAVHESVPGNSSASELAPVTLEGGSIADHAAAFGPNADTSDGDDASAAVGEPARVHPSAQQKRDRQTQQWATGRRRASSQQAGADDVVAINALTARIKAAEEAEGKDIARGEGESERVYQLRRRAEVLERRREAAKSPALAEAPRAAAHAAPIPTAVPASPPSKADGKPDATDAAKYPDGRYDPQYIEDLADWRANATWRDLQAKQQQETTRRSAEARWNASVAEAKAKHADFEAVAFAPTRIPTGSMIDHYILERKSGPDVLYHLQSHPQELDALLQMSDAADQFEALALLSQRLASPPPAVAGMTGAAAGSPPRVLPPKPPTPVRTEAQRVGDGPPATDGTLSLAEHAKQFGPKRPR